VRLWIAWLRPWRQRRRRGGGRAGGRRGRRARREGVWRHGRDRTGRTRYRQLEETAQVRGPGVGELGRGARWREEQSEVEEGRRAQGALDAMEQQPNSGAGPRTHSHT
jgi:hypothetical protein